MARSEKAEKTYQQILEVSQKLFREQGYEQTSIQDILNELKMSKGAVYHHFKSKKEILNAIEEETHQKNMVFMKQLVKESTGENAREKMSQVFLKYITAFNFEEHDKERMMAHLDPHTIVSDIKGQTEPAKFLEDLLKEGICDGSIETEYPLEAMEVFFVLMGIWLNPILYPRTIDEARKRMKYLQLLMKKMGIDLFADEMVEIVLNEFEKGGYYEK